MAQPRIVRVRGYQRAEDGTGVVQKVTAESTAPRLQDFAGHQWVRPRAEESTPDPGDGYVWLDLIATDDEAFAPAGRRWKLTLWGRHRPLRHWWVEVPYADAVPTKFGPGGREDPDGATVMPSLWLTDLADFADELGGPPVGSLANYYTRAQVDQKLRALVLEGGGAQLLDDLHDVDSSTAAPGDVLTRDDAGWTPRPLVHTHTQPSAAKTWLIAHPLTRPSDVRVTGPDGRRLYPQRIAFPQPGQCIVTFTVAQAGVAVLH